MKHTTKTVLAATTAALAAFICQPSAQAQTADSLIDKLVEKGVLSVKEGQALRDESDKDFTRAYSAKSGMPDWVTSMAWKGDLRLRYDHVEADNAGAMSRGRYRLRLRFGMEASLTDDFAVGFRLASGGTTDPISTNQSFTDNGTKKAITIDTAYARWLAINQPSLRVELTGGKMENIFVGKNLKFSDSVFDSDYTPEGVAVESIYTIQPGHDLAFGVGAFALSETTPSQDEAGMLVYKTQLNSMWNQHVSTSLGFGGYVLDNFALVPAAGTGANTGNNTVGQTFTPLVVDGSATYTLESFPMYNGAFPISVAGEYIVNPQGPSGQNTAWSLGLTLGKSGKKGLWDVSYRYKDVQSNSVWEDVNDSDWGAAVAATPTPNAHSYVSGTGIRGHITQGQYNFTDGFNVSLKWFWTENTTAAAAAQSLDTHRVQMDFVWKF